ncbi:unnamed protein product [Danaus chrysippus]|uniref:(African queen) hypothetical protein n=1 Tax=Danaus chrysippus TaxID=151541 RepID=A0A8J2VRG3_9NEOP|nr:unnamed protein product [Danaus chrysippus]
MIVDILIKGLHRPNHEAFSRAMGLRSGENVIRNGDKRLNFVPNSVEDTQFIGHLLFQFCVEYVTSPVGTPQEA